MRDAMLEKGYDLEDNEYGGARSLAQLANQCASGVEVYIGGSA